MDTDNFFFRCGHQPKRIGFAQVIFLRERQFEEVFSRFDLRNACFCELFAVKAAGGIRYVLPQCVHPAAETEINLLMRVSRPTGKVRITARQGETVLASSTKLKTAPGEMEKLIIRPGTLVAGIPVTVSMEQL